MSSWKLSFMRRSDSRSISSRFFLIVFGICGNTASSACVTRVVSLRMYSMHVYRVSQQFAQRLPRDRSS